MRQLPSQLDGQARTVALRFVLVYASLELASPIIGLPAGDTLAGIKQCFADWLAITGTGKREDKIIIEQANDFSSKTPAA